jgi:hypothetical protein
VRKIAILYSALLSIVALPAAAEVSAFSVMTLQRSLDSSDATIDQMLGTRELDPEVLAQIRVVQSRNALQKRLLKDLEQTSARCKGAPAPECPRQERNFLAELLLRSRTQKDDIVRLRTLYGRRDTALGLSIEALDKQNGVRTGLLVTLNSA